MTFLSGVAFTLLTLTPTYWATKAAIHPYAFSLREQLQETSIEVLELAPPCLQTELMGEHQAVDPRAMPLGEFIAEVVEIIESVPNARRDLRRASRTATKLNPQRQFWGVFTQLNSIRIE